MAGRSRCHIAQHEIGGAADRSNGGKVPDIAREEYRAGQRCRLREVHADDAAVAGPAGDTVYGDLRPAARCTAEVDDALARPQQAKPIVELDQLEGGARAVAEPPRL